ncbi:MAG: thioredoxin-dependent thiol peroxidase [Elusimicrobia bacterium]|nr:thioredoxin-dependent thiol peroxidase [Elusimicrobiota bacterium]MBI4217845.1 thioredoxin-dependent thiol peroxidase [Elusimicrobiota bacterium]
MKTKSQEVVEGSLAPDFELKDQDGKSARLSDLKGKTVVLYFYPKDDTPGCTTEACSFKDNLKQFQDLGAVILGVSLDDAPSHQKFINKFQLNFPLLCDEDAKVSRLYGVYKKKNLYARLFWGIERSTFVIGPDGNVKRAFRKVKVDGHTAEVLNAIKS